MNRIPLWSKPELNSPNPTSPKIEQAALHRTQRRGVHYSVFSPVHYEANYQYPLLIWLHGDGDDERQLNKVMPFISMRNYVAAGVRGPNSQSGGYGWGAGHADISQAEQRVAQTIEFVRESFNISSKRVFLAGLQSGGTTAFRLALKNPAQYAGVLSVGGPFPDDRPLRHLNEVRQLPMFIAQGRDSLAYPQSRACQELRLFHAAGLHATVRQYPCGEEVDVQMLNDMDVWMMQRVTGIDMTAEQHPLQPGDGN